MSVTLNPPTDWTTRPAATKAYARSNNTAVLTYKGGPIQQAGTPSMSDPSTGAIGQWPPQLAAANQLQPSSPATGVRNISSFWFVAGLLFVTIWLESGKRGSI